MNKLFTILLSLCFLQGAAQDIDTTIRDRWQRIWVVDVYNGTPTNRYAYVYIPSGWSPANPQHYTMTGYGGDGTRGTWADTTKDTPGHLLGTANPYGQWNARVVRNDGDTALFVVAEIPYYGSSAQTAGSYDAYNALVRKIMLQTGQDLNTPDYKLLAAHPSGGPARFIETRESVNDTANAYIKKFKRVLFMSPTNGASAAMSTYYWQNGRYRVFFSKGDTNPGTTPLYAYRLYDSLRRRGNSEVFIDSVASGGHGSATWDKYMNTSQLNAPAGTGGDATTNPIRWLIEDYAVGAANQLPIVDAGANITTSGTSTTLNGSATDPDGTIVSYAWTKVSGTGGTITTPSAASTTVTGLSVGTYVFQLKATDNDGAFTTDQVTVTVQSSNVAPTAYAGSDKYIQLPTNYVTLNGSFSSDPDGTISTYAWSKISGGAATLNQPNNDVCNVVNLVEGSYVFRLTITDNSGATATDDVSVQVDPATNAAPVADAGPDKVIVLPTNSVILDGSGSNDSDGTITSYVWSGPATITNGTTATPTISNLTEGTFTYALTVTDNTGATSTDTVQVLVVGSSTFRVYGRKPRIIN